LRIERRPDHCVVFDSSPHANTAAQEIEMRCVSLVGPYPRYELLTADTSAFSFDELTAMNIRRLFGERVYDQPMLDTQANLETVKKTKTMYWDHDD
jgi:beta-phosphoglucomutase-like phosphatase (HAD superfamily)